MPPDAHKRRCAAINLKVDKIMHKAQEVAHNRNYAAVKQGKIKYTPP